MGMWIGRNRKARVTYGFDEIALVPGEVTINPNEVDTSFKIPRKDGSAIELKIPIIASAMDGVTDVRFCIAMGKLGGLGVINLEGVQTRYANPSEVLGANCQSGQGRHHHPDSKSLYRADQGGTDRAAHPRTQSRPASWPPSVPFRKGRSALAPLPRRRAPIFSSSNPPFPLSNINPPNTNPSSWLNSAAR